MSRSLPVAALVLSVVVACSSSSPSKATSGLQCSVATSTLVQTPSGGGAPVAIAINGCRASVSAATGCTLWDVYLELTGTIAGGTAVTLGLGLDLTTLQQTGTFTGGVTDVGCQPNGVLDFGNWSAPTDATVVVSSTTTWPDPTNTSASPPPSMVSMQINGMLSAVPFSTGTINGAVVANITGSAAASGSSSGGSSSGGSSSGGSSSGGSSGGLPGCTPTGGACTRAMDTCCSGSCGNTTTDVCDAQP
jgi:uncharacterized membrane protein YgcG